MKRADFFDGENNNRNQDQTAEPLDTREKDELLLEFRDQVTEAGFGQYLRDSMREAEEAADRKGIVVDEDGIYLTFVARAFGHQEFGELVCWNMDELEEDGDVLTSAVNAVKDFFTMTDDELNEAVLNDTLIVPFTPYEMDVWEWKEQFVYQELESRVNSVEELKKLWGKTALYAEWSDGSDSLLQENGYTLEETIGYMEDGIHIYRDEPVRDLEEDPER